jgi:UDP-N-acetylbacillosamine N-acetyltransferase
MRQPIVIWGTAGHALVVADIIRLQGEYEIIGFLDDINLDRHHTEFCGASVLGGREQLDGLRQKGVNTLILGFGDCLGRLKLAELVATKGFRCATAIHPQAIIASDVQIGQGSVAAAGAVINPGSHIGEQVIINTCASVDHECRIANGVHICPGAHLAGRVMVGMATWVGIGAIVVDRVRIGAGTLIGAGAVVVNDIPDGVVAYGVPARVIKKMDEHG